MISGVPAGGKAKCRATTKRGAPCKAFAVDGGWCLSHDPKGRKEAQAARSEGAVARNKLVALGGRRRRLETPVKMVRFLSGLTQDVVVGDIKEATKRRPHGIVPVHRQHLAVALMAGHLLRKLEDAATTRALRAAWEYVKDPPPAPSRR